MIFYKHHGAGNDFIFFLDTPARPESAEKLCNRHTGIGGDGVVWLQRKIDNQFRWDFFNSDGSAAEMCGNAARCAMRLVEKQFGLKEMELETRAGMVSGRVDGDVVSVSFEIANAPIREIEHPAGKDYPRGYLLTTGVPHCVIPVTKPHALGARTLDLAPFIKNPAFGPGGANLTFANLQAEPVQTVSLERGVEEFTLACGTGVIATARVYQHLNKTTAPLKLQTPGGNFTVNFDGLRATLTGPAEFVFQGEDKNA